MPSCLSPKDAFWLTLRCDLPAGADSTAEPPADVPAFGFRCLSGRQQRELAGKLDALDALPSGVAAVDATFGLLGELLVGWRGVESKDGSEVLPFEAERIPDVLTFGEASELLWRVFSWRAPPGFCASPASTPSAASAGPTPAAAAG